MRRGVDAHKLVDDPVVQQVAAKYNKSAAQVRSHVHTLE